MPAEFNNETEEQLQPEFLALLEKILADYYLVEAIPEESIVGVTFVDNPYIQEVNREYRGIDRPTDVLSFPMYESKDDMAAEVETLAELGMLEEQEILLGDIVISLERAREQAAEYGHSNERELCYLFVHGLMHLAGYDHEEEEEKKEMRQHEEALLEKVGVTREA